MQHHSKGYWSQRSQNASSLCTFLWGLVWFNSSGPVITQVPRQIESSIHSCIHPLAFLCLISSSFLLMVLTKIMVLTTLSSIQETRHCFLAHNAPVLGRMPQNLAGSSLSVYHLCFGIVLRAGNVPAGPDGTTSDVFHSRDIADEIRLDNEVKKKKSNPGKKSNP